MQYFRLWHYGEYRKLGSTA